MPTFIHPLGNMMSKTAGLREKVMEAVSKLRTGPRARKVKLTARRAKDMAAAMGPDMINKGALGGAAVGAGYGGYREGNISGAMKGALGGAAIGGFGGVVGGLGSGAVGYSKAMKASAANMKHYRNEIRKAPRPKGMSKKKFRARKEEILSDINGQVASSRIEGALRTATPGMAAGAAIGGVAGGGMTSTKKKSQEKTAAIRQAFWRNLEQ